ncbi:tetratricopeptide repeat protein [Portibacter lacus]|uniref:Tetratricopeptide repeat protein n=1 Tax=Portibacter lacus TaxID=1099794 RepID=A0AA37WC61_9BACT|nr:tetratricopeptide repeat protein [Portibacter lacus]GLR16166.1 hypothetical protein GCM10007940_07810 [Portibacter lacus]
MKYFLPLFIIIACSCKKGIDPRSLALSIQSEKLENQNEIINLNEEAIQIDPKNYRAYNNLAIAQLKTKKDTSEVIFNLNRALQLAPKYDIAFYNLVNVYHEFKDYSNVITKGEEYLLNSTNTHIVALVGEAYNYQEQWSKAAKYLEKAVKLDSTRAGTLKELGKAQMFLGNLDIALSNLDKAIELDPNYHQAYNRRAIVYSEIGDYEKALKDYNKSISIHQSGTYFYNRGILFAEKIQNMEKACKDLQSANDLSHKLSLGYYEMHCK